MSDEAQANRTATRVLHRDGQSVGHLMRVFKLSPLDGGDAGQQFAQPCVRVGSRRGCDLVLSDPAVSRIHFEIVAGPAGFRLRDLESSNGTKVDGYEVHDIHLKDGSLIEIGSTKLRFEIAEEEAALPFSETPSLGPLVGGSVVMREIFGVIKNVSCTDFTVLVEGESGVGKELVAEAVHAESPRAEGPLVVFDCAAVPATLMESELFGHQKGAFTGATSNYDGCLARAHGGTLFLDEIGELPLDLQPKLLRALEKREVRPVGSNTVKQVDVRIVAATNRDLAAEVNRRAFRGDLYYRLAVVRLIVPPLRDRPDDVRLLVRHFIDQCYSEDPTRASTVASQISDENWATLEAYPWPGNVRELKNMVERTVALAGETLPAGFEPMLGPSPSPIRPSTPPKAASPQSGSGADLPSVDVERPFLELKAEVIAALERAYLAEILERCDGKISRAASAAAIDRTYFKRLMRKHGIES